jgi:hypothetical protein
MTTTGSYSSFEGLWRILGGIQFSERVAVVCPPPQVQYRPRDEPGLFDANTRLLCRFEISVR